MSMPGKKRVPNAREMEIIDVMRKILQGRIHTTAEVELALAKHAQEWREALCEMLDAFLRQGEKAFWRLYEVIVRCYPQYGQWHDLLSVPAPLDDPVPQTPRPPFVLLSDVQEREVQWLWYPRLALGKITMLDGDPGQGKSMLTLDLAARMTRGITMPDLTSGLSEPAGVVLVLPEDDLADTVRPRLRRAGADLSRVAALTTIPVTNASGQGYERPFSLFEDLDVLSETIDRVQARLVIVDAVMKLLGGKDIYRANEVMAALTPLQLLLEHKGVAGLFLRHLTKGSSGMNSLYRGMGSIAFAGLARMTMIVYKDPYDQQKSVLYHNKSNNSEYGSQLSFSVQYGEPPDDTRPHICWHGECHYSESELNSGSSSPHSAGSFDERKPNTARDEILRVLEEHAPEELTPKQVADELSDIPLSTVQVTLQRLAKDGMVEQPQRGKYSLTTD